MCDIEPSKTKLWFSSTINIPLYFTILRDSRLFTRSEATCPPSTAHIEQHSSVAVFVFAEIEGK